MTKFMQGPSTISVKVDLSNSMSYIHLMYIYILEFDLSLVHMLAVAHTQDPTVFPADFIVFIHENNYYYKDLISNLRSSVIYSVNTGKCLLVHFLQHMHIYMS